MRTLAPLLLLLLAACEIAPQPAATMTPPSNPGVDPAVLATFEPLPDAVALASNPATPAKVALGRMLDYG